MKKIKSFAGVLPPSGVASFANGGSLDPGPKGRRVVKGSAASYYQDPKERKLAESLGAIKDYGTFTRKQYQEALDNPDLYPADHPLVSSYGTYQSMRKEFQNDPSLSEVSVGELYDTKIPNRPFGASDVGPNIYQKVYQDPITDVSSGPIYGNAPVEQPLSRTNPIVYDRSHYMTYDKPGSDQYKRDSGIVNRATKRSNGGRIAIKPISSTTMDNSKIDFSLINKF